MSILGTYLLGLGLTRFLLGGKIVFQHFLLLSQFLTLLLDSPPRKLCNTQDGRSSLSTTASLILLLGASEMRQERCPEATTCRGEVQTLLFPTAGCTLLHGPSGQARGSHEALPGTALSSGKEGPSSQRHLLHPEILINSILRDRV